MKATLGGKDTSKATKNSKGPEKKFDDAATYGKDLLVMKGAGLQNIMVPCLLQLNADKQAAFLGDVGIGNVMKGWDAEVKRSYKAVAEANPTLSAKATQ